MKSGFLPRNERQARDDVIAGTDKDPARLSAGLSDDEPLDGAPGEELPAVAARS